MILGCKVNASINLKGTLYSECMNYAIHYFTVETTVDLPDSHVLYNYSTYAKIAKETPLKTQTNK